MARADPTTLAYVVNRMRLSMELETMSRTEMRQLKRSAGMGVTFSLPMSENILGRWLCRAATSRSLKLKLKVSVLIKIKLNYVSIFLRKQ